MLFAILLAVTVLLMSSVVAIVQTNAPYHRLSPARSAELGVWCPATRQLQRIRAGPSRGSSYVAVLACDRFPHGVLICDRSCLKSLRGLELSPRSFDVQHALVFPSRN